MAITNYTELQTAVAEWAHRDVSQIVDFIALAEKRINSLLQSRLAEVDATLTGSIGSRTIALPSGFMFPYGLWCTTYDPRIEIFYVTPESLPVVTTSNSRPYYYTIDGSNIAFDYPNDIEYTYTFRYKKGYDIASSATNDILTNYPGVYLFGALVEHSLFSRDLDAVAVFEQRFQEAIQSCIEVESRNKAQSTLRFDNALVDTRVNIIDGGF